MTIAGRVGSPHIQLLFHLLLRLLTTVDYSVLQHADLHHPESGDLADNLRLQTFISILNSLRDHYFISVSIIIGFKVDSTAVSGPCEDAALLIRPALNFLMTLYLTPPNQR